MVKIKPYLTLCRLNISLFAACSAATGYFLGPYPGVAGVLAPATAVFLLACGASAMNQYQERDIDAKMERTRQRPLPSGIVTPAQALSLSLTLIIAGLVLLAHAGGVKVFIPGLLSLLWYNGIYTALKKITAFASVPGAVVGMIPPAIGWAAAGGVVVDARLSAICFIFFMWQVPHFWLLLLNHGDEYEKAGLPSLTRTMSKLQIARVTFVWIVAATIASLALPLYGSVRSPLVYYSFIPLAAWLIWSERSLTGRKPLLSVSPVLFRKINIYLFLIMSLLSFENIFFRMP
jgi:protoheme IX farnesyltransferase